ncbi:hypothetical protein K491DRAFT_591957 [Lophiostoma macrostomum CBS 122681]|uniref:Uncharacterized protein n=1 Tax=Lophiostoma macrostomum CBS 122681 TaxID=1314788 RepID=A0A6A6TJ36_9PLEO|nr:hypothetical protein K491DRAFT_591957 [Lophiostoma macrostomum CBS 122681]
MARLRRKSIARSLVTYVLSSKLQWPGQPVELSYLLRHARNTQSSQSKDKIYAFLGLTHTRYGIPIRYQPSYTINALLTDTARSIITREASRLNILVDAGTSVPNRQLTSSTDPLPSWVSDWTSSRSERHDDFIEALGFPPNCTAGSHPQGKVESYLAQFEADAFGNPARILVAWRSYGTTSGIVTATTCSIAQADDEVWIVSSVKWPLVMRREKIGTMVLLGPAMLHDARSGTVSPIMTGHGLDQREQYWQPLKLS